MNWLGRIFAARRSMGGVGGRGEKLAAKWLKRHGYRILERNRVIVDDEADLIALDPDRRTVVIVEVKTRRDEAALPEQAMTKKKRFRLSRLAARLSKSPKYQNRPLRFDVIAINLPDRGEPAIRHAIGAFESPW